MPNTRRSKRLKTKQRSKPAVPVYARPEALNIVLQLLGPYLSTKDLARCALVSKAFSNMARDPLLVPRKLSLRQYFGDFVHFTHHPALFPRFFNKVAPFLLSLDVSDVRDFPLSTLIHIDFPNLESLRLTAYQSRYALYGGSSSVPGEAVRRLLEEPFILPSLKLIFFFSSFISATGCTRGYHIGHDAISIGKHLLNAISKARPQLLTDVAFCEACKTWTAGRQDDGSWPECTDCSEKMCIRPGCSASEMWSCHDCSNFNHCKTRLQCTSPQHTFLSRIPQTCGHATRSPLLKRPIDGQQAPPHIVEWSKLSVTTSFCGCNPIRRFVSCSGCGTTLCPYCHWIAGDLSCTYCNKALCQSCSVHDNSHTELGPENTIGRLDYTCVDCGTTACRSCISQDRENRAMVICAASDCAKVHCISCLKAKNLPGQLMCGAYVNCGRGVCPTDTPLVPNDDDPSLVKYCRRCSWLNDGRVPPPDIPTAELSSDFEDWYDSELEAEDMLSAYYSDEDYDMFPYSMYYGF